MLKMLNEVTGSIEMECERRLTNLYIQSHTWLLQVSYNICKSYTDSEDLVSMLYEYLHNKKNPKLFWKEDSYNLIYCMKFLQHRWLNQTKKKNRIKYIGEIHCDDETQFEEYDVQKDIDIMETYDRVKEELNRLKGTKMWTSAKLYELYWYSDKNLNEVADAIGISKSTTFLAIRKIRTHMKEILDNPFND
jgi:DNA-directed RNA polymerase specialized sigma24 family protein